MEVEGLTFFVHDTRANLVMHPHSGIQQAREPEVEQALNAKGDTLNVSYAAFEQKIKLIERQLKVHDPKIAEWLLLIIMSPSIAPAAIRKQAPELTDHQLNIMYELVATWMLAEPARHASTMLSGVMELELIEAGRRTFAQSLAKSKKDAHPMSHIGSEAHGRDAEAAELSIGQGGGRSKSFNANSVLNKQKEQLAATSGPSLMAAKTDLMRLVHFYTTELQQAIGRERTE